MVTMTEEDEVLNSVVCSVEGTADAWGVVKVTSVVLQRSGADVVVMYTVLLVGGNVPLVLPLGCAEGGPEVMVVVKGAADGVAVSMGRLAASEVVVVRGIVVVGRLEVLAPRVVVERVVLTVEGVVIHHGTVHIAVAGRAVLTANGVVDTRRVVSEAVVVRRVLVAAGRMVSTIDGVVDIHHSVVPVVEGEVVRRVVG